MVEKSTNGHIRERRGRLENILPDRKFSLNQNQIVVEPKAGALAWIGGY